MRTPCDNCPFRSDRPFRALRKKRAIDIHESLFRDGDFPCHKTVDYSGNESNVTRDSHRCLGAAAYLEQTRRGGAAANVMFRMAVMCKEFTTSDIDGIVNSGVVCSSKQAFIKNACG